MSWTPERKLEAAIQAPMGGPGALFHEGEIVERPGWYEIVTPDGGSEIVFSQVDDPERSIDDLARRPLKWCVGPWTRPADMGERLARRGFRSWDVRGMGIATDALASDDRVREAVTEAELDRYAAICARGWDDPRDLRERTRICARREPRMLHFFLAEHGTAGLILRENYGYLVGAQVLESARGTGIYRALVAARLAFLRGRGLEYAVTHAREETSAPRLERVGFETLFRSKCYLLDK